MPLLEEYYIFNPMSRHILCPFLFRLVNVFVSKAVETISKWWSFPDTSWKMAWFFHLKDFALCAM